MQRGVAVVLKHEAKMPFVNCAALAVVLFTTSTENLSLFFCQG